MDHFKEQISQVTDHFLGEVADLARKHAASLFTSAFSSLDGGPKNPRSAPGDAAGGRQPTTGQTASASASASSGRGRGVKRGPHELEQLGGRFVSFVRENQGLRIEQINKKLGTTTSDLALPIRKLIAGGVIATKGAKRSTTYHLNKSFVSRATRKAGKAGEPTAPDPKDPKAKPDGKVEPRAGGGSKSSRRSRKSRTSGAKSRATSSGRRSKPRIGPRRPGRAAEATPSVAAKEAPVAK